MAIIKQSGPKFDIGSAVAGRLQAIQSARSKARLADEARFLTVVNENGMTYDDQLSYREAQLNKEKSAPSPNEDYIQELSKDIGSLKTLAAQTRFSKAYADSFDEVSGGRKSLQSHVAFLEDQLSKSSNPALNADIRQKLSQARADLRKSDDTTLENFITYAQNSKERDVLDQALTRVGSERTKALANGEDDYASVLALKEQGLRQARATAEIDFKSNQLKLNALQNPHPVRTLDFITKSVGEASDSGAVVIDGKRYDSERDYWVQKRGDYISGGGFFTDLKDYYGKWIGNALEKNPDLAASVMLQSKDTFATLATRPELLGFEVQLGDALVNTVGKGAHDYAKMLIDNARTTYDFQAAADRIADLSKTTGIDLSAESNALIRDTANVRADQYQAIAERAQELVNTGSDRSGAFAQALKEFNAGDLGGQQLSPKDLATKSTSDLTKQADTAKPVAEIKTTPAPSVETRKPLETTTMKMENGVEVPVTTTEATPTVSSTTTVTQPPPTAPVVDASKTPAAAPTPKKMATLVNETTKDRQAVEVDSPQSKDLFGKGYILEVKPPTK